MNSTHPAPAEDWQPTATREALLLRARLYALIRAFMAERQILEVETPVLSSAGTTDPHIASLTTTFDGPHAPGERTRWLRTSPEYALKRLLAAGIGDCYELGRVFRNGEAGGRHNPEFTMLEWYRLGLEHLTLAEEVIALIQQARALAGLPPAQVQWRSYRELFIEHLDIDPFKADIQSLAHAFGPGRINPEGLRHDDWLDLLLSHEIQPKLPADTLTVLHAYPPSQCALARIEKSHDGVDVAARFEVYSGPLELANGYYELTDASEQAQRFADDHARRAEHGATQPAIDARLLAAMRHGLPACAGVALGVDRLLMALMATARIQDVLAFPFSRA